MAGDTSSSGQPSVQHHPQIASRNQSASTASTLKAFLITIMGLLSIFVFGLAIEYKSVIWLGIGFICALIAGFFVQCLINRSKTVR
jgi:hypothetical protein